MELDIIVSSRPDREIRKKVIIAGDYNIVPYEDAKCKVNISDIKCEHSRGDGIIDAESCYFSSKFNGNLIIGDCDNFLDKDLELIIQQMCKGEICLGSLVYKNHEGKVQKSITFKLELEETSVEDLVSDWDYTRLLSTSIKHKERGVELTKDQRIAEAFRRFSKALKFLVAMEPMNAFEIPDEKVAEIIDLKVKLFNNLAHCQLFYNEYEAALDLCNRALVIQPENVKSLYRRHLAYVGLNMYDEAWQDVLQVTKLDPNNVAAQQMLNKLRPKMEKINQNYITVIKKMFG